MTPSWHKITSKKQPKMGYPIGLGSQKLRAQEYWRDNITAQVSSWVSRPFQKRNNRRWSLWIVCLHNWAVLDSFVFFFLRQVGYLLAWWVRLCENGRFVFRVTCGVDMTGRDFSSIRMITQVRWILCMTLKDSIALMLVIRGCLVKNIWTVLKIDPTTYERKILNPHQLFDDTHNNSYQCSCWTGGIVVHTCRWYVKHISKLRRVTCNVITV